MLKEASSILRDRPSRIDKSRLARTLFKLSHIEDMLEDKAACKTRKQAEDLYSELTGESTVPSSESQFDLLVPYI